MPPRSPEDGAGGGVAPPRRAPARRTPVRIDIDEAVRALLAGGVVACPTEAVWGLSCDPRDESALARLVALKGRDGAKGLILVAADARQLVPWLAPPEPAWRSRMDLAWPGPVTFVAPAARGLPPLLTGGRTTLAVRVSDHPTLIALAEGLGRPIVSTSANRSGEKPLKTPASIAREFGDGIRGIVAGELGGRRKPSDIVDVRTGKRLR